jgi:hypothetical protein
MNQFQETFDVLSSAWGAIFKACFNSHMAREKM